MLFDNLTQTEADLVGYVKDACAALAYLRQCHPAATLEPGMEHDEWTYHMNRLNNARVWIQMAGEYLHDDLNRFNDQVIASHKRRQRRRAKQAKQEAFARPADDFTLADSNRSTEDDVFAEDE